MSALYYKEEQRMKQSWIWLILAFLSAIGMTILLYYQLALHIPVGNEPMSNTGLIIVSIVVPLSFLLIYWIFIKSVLITEIRSDGIHFKFPVFINKAIVCKYPDIESINITTYKPLRHAGGHGIKTSGNVKYLTVSGNKIVRIHMKSGKIYIIGTQNSQQIESAINKAQLRNS